MTDYRDPNDPLRRTDLSPDVGSSNAGAGWIGASIFVIIIIALIVGLGRTDTQTAATDAGAPPAATKMAPPATTGAAPPATMPRTTTGEGAK
jgi:hypothetical protein